MQRERTGQLPNNVGKGWVNFNYSRINLCLFQAAFRPLESFFENGFQVSFYRSYVRSVCHLMPYEFNQAKPI